jgi:hypothetical protein
VGRKAGNNKRRQSVGHFENLSHQNKLEQLFRITSQFAWGFDTLQEYLVNCQVVMVGNGALPCIHVESF